MYYPVVLTNPPIFFLKVERVKNEQKSTNKPNEKKRVRMRERKKQKNKKRMK